MIKENDKEIYDRNRYNDILVYEKSRVVLKNVDINCKYSDYINACYVDSPIGKQKLIAS